MLTLRYEDILADPLPTIAGLGAFLGEGFADECWAARCAALVRAPRFTWRSLPDEEARALTEACRPGFERLRAAGVSYDM